MDTSHYLFAGYALFWLIPTLYLLSLSRKIAKLTQRVEELKK